MDPRSYIYVYAVALLAGSPTVTHADSWSKARDGAKTSVKKVGHIVEETITLGSAGRERDREKARQAEAQANATKARAARERAEALKNQESLLLVTQEKQRILNDTLSQLEIFEKSTQRISKLTKELLAQASAQKTSNQLIREMVIGQQADMLRLISTISVGKLDNEAKDSIAQRKNDLMTKVQNYQAQMEAFPTTQITPQTAQAWSDELFGQSFEILEAIRDMRAWLRTEIKSTDETVVILSNSVAELKK